MNSTKNHLSFEESATKNWYLTAKAQKPPCKVKVLLNDGKSYLYRSVNTVKKDDVTIIGSRCKSAGAMGRVVDNTNTSAGKTHLANAEFVFSQNPDADEIKKSAAKIYDTTSFSTLTKLFEKKLAYQEVVPIAEIDIQSVLFAINVLAHKNLISSSAVKKAKEFLETEKTFPSALFSNETITWIEQNGNPYDVIISASLYGLYPNWEADFSNLSIWDNADDNIELYYEYNDEDNNNEVYSPSANEELEKLLSSDSDLNAAYNKLIYFSALSALIRGGFTNLLDAALTVSLPIDSFFDEIIEFSKNIGSTYCSNIISKYSAADFLKKKISKKPIGEVDNISNDFKMEGTTLLAYKGNDEIVTIPEGVKTIGENAFLKSKLRKIIFAESVTKIKASAFYECEQLEEIVFNKKLAEIYEMAFWGCISLKNIDLSHTSLKKLKFNVFRNCSNLENVLLPETLTSLPLGTFECTNIKSIVLPKSIEIVSRSAFYRSPISDIYVYWPKGTPLELDNYPNTAIVHYISE